MRPFVHFGYGIALFLGLAAIFYSSRVAAVEDFIKTKLQEAKDINVIKALVGEIATIRELKTDDIHYLITSNDLIYFSNPRYQVSIWKQAYDHQWYVCFTHEFTGV